MRPVLQAQRTPQQRRYHTVLWRARDERISVVIAQRRPSLPALRDERDGPHAQFVSDKCAAKHAGPRAEDAYAAVREPDDNPVWVDRD